jgi:hypothetical protein
VSPPTSLTAALASDLPGASCCRRAGRQPLRGFCRSGRGAARRAGRASTTPRPGGARRQVQASLGSRILRVETAAIVAVALAEEAFGALSPGNGCRPPALRKWGRDRRSREHTASPATHLHLHRVHPDLGPSASCACASRVFAAGRGGDVRSGRPAGPDRGDDQRGARDGRSDAEPARGGPDLLVAGILDRSPMAVGAVGLFVGMTGLYQLYFGGMSGQTPGMRLVGIV